MRIDAHVHIWRSMPAHSNPAVTIVSPASDVPIELLSEYMDEHGIDRAVLVQPMYPGEDNAYVAGSAAAQPERFAAVCFVDPRSPDAADRLAYWISQRGCKGLRLRPRIPDESAVFGAPATFALWEQARQLNVVVNVLANPEHLQTVAALSERFPDVPVLLDHMAHPEVSTGLEAAAFQNLLALARYPRMYVKPTGYYYYSQGAYPYRDCWDLFRAVYDSFGPERLVWGSDFPHVLLKSGYRRAIELQSRAYSYLSQTDLALIMGGNAAALYWNQ